MNFEKGMPDILELVKSRRPGVPWPRGLAEGPSSRRGRCACKHRGQLASVEAGGGLRP